MEPEHDTPLVVTQGDPRGVGPQLILALAARGRLRPGDRVVASHRVMAGWAERLPVDWAKNGWARVQPLLDPIDDGLTAGASQVAALTRGVDRVLEHRGAALVTAPIDKHACREAGFDYPGHTEYLAARAGGVDVAMLMAGQRLRVVPVTIHVPLREVPRRLCTEDIVRAGTLLIEGLGRRFSIARPRVAVAGLNPHAGERGMLGDEEHTVIEPAIAELRAGHDAEISGPVPADTAFAAHYRGRYDAVLAMYHDQGLGPFKLIHFTDGVNMTLGLPFVRTSPDHGTALDIAELGTADPSSMDEAIALARSCRP